MKKIVLLPVKNESWILRQSLENFSEFADHILVADQDSNDESLEIYKEFSKVTVIKNPGTGHNNSVRWLLLDTARKLFRTSSEPCLIFCLDADEMISKKSVEFIERLSDEHLKQEHAETVSFELPWIQLWKDVYHYRSDGIWINNYKAIAFVDNPKLDYKRTLTINDHTLRIPQTSEVIKLPEHPVLHFQFIAWDMSQIKQAWYRASELIDGKSNERRINHKYGASGPKNALIFESPKEWLAMIPQAKKVKFQKNILESWHLKTLNEWFSKHGIDFFESLDIWHIDYLRDMFIEAKKRTPKPKFYPKLIVALNNLKNKFKKWLKKYI